jgi:hypothetical protein
MKRHEQDRSAAADASTAVSERAARVETISKARRTLLKAGWVAPVVAVVSLPASGYAVNSSSAPCNDPEKC